MLQKIKEYNDFTAFAKLYFAEHVVFSQPSPPEPDITLILNDKKIGCELTTIFVDNIPGRGGKDSDQKKSESIQDWICNSITEWLHKNLPESIEIKINFKSIQIYESQKEPLKKEILELIKINIPELNLSEYSFYNIVDRKLLPREVDYIRLAFVPKRKNSIAIRIGGCMVPRLDEERILLNVSAKEKLILNYKDLVDEKWLILVIQDYLLSSEFDIPEKPFKIESIFDKVFLFLRRDNKIIVLK